MFPNHPLTLFLSYYKYLCPLIFTGIMSNNNLVSTVYRFVIDDVISNVRNDFEDMGIDEAVLMELQRSWEQKVAESQVAGLGEHDEEYDYNEEYESQQLHSQQPSGETAVQAAANLATLASASVAIQNTESNGVGRPQPFLPPRSIEDQSQIASQLHSQQQHQQLQQQHHLHHQQPKPQQPQQQTQQGMSGNRLVLPGGSGRIPQLDGADDTIAIRLEDIECDFTITPRTRRIAQVDGEEDADDDINSELDDTDEEEENADGEDGAVGGNIVLCLYDKVTRTKNKWKCILKDGVVFLNGRDYLFHKANGDFEW
ncbi:uncharacterized protein VTP21DRAFT_575 [Calcarisporiella thermophila]|uniref:uncharacterized protein n=1 Tax=Calcarisporiella thermophila TaxID=911321 RepID=UPI00374206E6